MTAGIAASSAGRRRWAQVGRGEHSRRHSRMVTKLERPLKREISIDGKPYTLTVDRDGFKLVEKGRRKGQEVRWRDLVSGGTALTVALNASLENIRE